MNARACLVALALSSNSATAGPDKLEPDDSALPGAESRRGDVQVQLPTLPAFTIPVATGVRTVRELRIAGAKLLDTEVTVKGVITWAYDCVTDVRKPGESERQTRKRIDDDPTLCERPKFYVGDDANTPAEKSLWVVDVPRVYNKMELERIAKADRNAPDRCDPGDRKQRVCPTYKVGDVVTITGSFKISSPHSERNSDGLLVYKAMQNATTKWETQGSTWTATATPGTPIAAAAPMRPALPKLAKTPPMRVAIDAKAREAAKRHLFAANKLFGAKQIDQAIVEYGEATAAAKDTHLAWYGSGGALASRGDWGKAADAFGEAVRLRPDVAMYQMWRGASLYESTLQLAREDLAKRLNTKPENVTPDLAGINFEKALVPLLVAIQLEPRLWRAQFYVGKIDRATGAAKAAAEDFTNAIVSNPRETGPYIALAELYRKWDYTDEALAVATQGTQNVPGTNEASDVWFVLGMAHDDKREDAKAIEAFTKAIELRKDHAKALFQRGQSYFRMKDHANAKRDLEAFLKLGKPGLEFTTQQAQKLLMDLAAQKK